MYISSATKKKMAKMALVYQNIKNILISSERIFLWHLGFRNPPGRHPEKHLGSNDHPDLLFIPPQPGVVSHPDHYFADGFAVAAVEAPTETPQRKWSIADIMLDPFLWGVPKHRRPLWKIKMRRYGIQERFWKMIDPKKSLVPCAECGGFKEGTRMCPTCYERVKLETMEMQETIEKELGFSPVEKEVVVIYEGEQVDEKSEFWMGKRIVEMKKVRPPWFSKNLMQPTTQAPATTTAVEPKDLA